MTVNQMGPCQGIVYHNSHNAAIPVIQQGCLRRELVMAYNFSAFPEAVSDNWSCRAQSQLFSHVFMTRSKMWTWITSVSWQSRGQTAPWDAPNTASPACQKMWLSLCIQHWGYIIWTSCNALVHLVGLGEGFREALSCSPWYDRTSGTGSDLP